MNKPPLVNRMLTVCRTMMHGEPISFVEGHLAHYRAGHAVANYTQTFNKEVPDDQNKWFILSITKEGKCSIRNEYIETTLVDIDVNEII